MTVESLIAETIDFVQQRFKDYSIELKVKPIDPKLNLFCRNTEISQVILNLLNNAFDAIVKNSEKWVEIEVKSHDSEHIMITVTDSGHGIAPEIAHRIFDPFFSTKEKKYGTGLGLSISKGLIDRHHGNIEIDLNHKNTRFVIVLPVHQPHIT